MTETSSDGSIGEHIVGFHGVPPLSAPGGVEDTLQGEGQDTTAYAGGGVKYCSLCRGRGKIPSLCRGRGEIL